jgi:hypothetical protein
VLPDITQNTAKEDENKDFTAYYDEINGMEDPVLRALDEIHSRLAQEDIDSLLQHPRFTDNHFAHHSLSNEFEDTSEALNKQVDMKIVPKRIKFRKATTKRNNYRSRVKSRIEQALLQTPVMPPPSRETMLEMLHDIRYLQLVPYFKEEVGQARTDTGVKTNLLKVLDPKAFEKFRKKASENEKIYKRRRRQGDSKEKVIEMVSAEGQDAQDYYHEKDDSLSDKKSSKKEIVDGDLFTSSEEEEEFSRPSKQEMLRIFRSRGYTRLIPYFKKQISGLRSPSGIRRTIMKYVDPEAYAEVQEKQRQRDAKRSRRY